MIGLKNEIIDIDKEQANQETAGPPDGPRLIGGRLVLVTPPDARRPPGSGETDKGRGAKEGESAEPGAKAAGAREDDVLELERTNGDEGIGTAETEGPASEATAEEEEEGTLENELWWPVEEEVEEEWKRERRGEDALEDGPSRMAEMSYCVRLVERGAPDGVDERDRGAGIAARERAL